LPSSAANLLKEKHFLQSAIAEGFEEETYIAVSYY
jgi:hypothetical protein